VSDIAARIEAPSVPAVNHVAAYLRISTGRQAENDLSIPDQRRQIEQYCAARGWAMVEAYVERGSSATDECDVLPGLESGMLDQEIIVIIACLRRWETNGAWEGAYGGLTRSHGSLLTTRSAVRRCLCRRRPNRLRLPTRASGHTATAAEATPAIAAAKGGAARHHRTGALGL
jgi:hypothetical protein